MASRKRWMKKEKKVGNEKYKQMYSLIFIFIIRWGPAISC